MAAQCFGNFGTFKFYHPEYLEEKYLQSQNPFPEPKVQQDEDNIRGDSQQTVWVNKRYIPTDLRSTAPVPRHKLLAPKKLPEADQDWVPLGEPSLKKVSRASEEVQIYISQPSTRSEEWSTLRQILPSKGRPLRHRPPNWGTGSSLPPLIVPAKQARFPHINSPMTRYTDDMHLTNRLFKLH